MLLLLTMPIIILAVLVIPQRQRAKEKAKIEEAKSYKIHPLEMTIKADKERYAPGETIDLEVTIKNNENHKKSP